MDLDGLFTGLQVSPAGALVPACVPPADVPVLSAYQQYSLILPTGSIDLTVEQARRVQQHHQALIILGASGASPLQCAAGCPMAFRCPLATMQKAPVGQACPFEVDYVRVRFSAWLGGARPDARDSTGVRTRGSFQPGLHRHPGTTLSGDPVESRERRHGVRSVRDVDENGNVVCWEDVVHINRQILSDLTVQRRALLRDFELTPEAKTRKRKAEGPQPGSDLSSRMADNLDKLRHAQRTINVTAISLPS